MTTDITELAQREKFEAWLEGAEALPWGYLKNRRASDSEYLDPNITDMWAAWKGASAELVETLEKAQRANISAPAILRHLAEEKQKRGEVAAATAFNYAASALQKELSK
ncbi:TPA: hypothetical protein SMG93_005336 [Klebsiella oxytoca]|nr:hypothetical protein [Klebsiella oxytoca]